MADEEPKKEEEELELSSEPAEFPVTLKDKNGNKRKLVIKEVDGKQHGAYLTALSQRMKYDAKGKPTGIKTFDGLQSSLLSRCLHENGTLLSVAQCEALPSSTQTALFKKAVEICGLAKEDDEDEEIKNEQED